MRMASWKAPGPDALPVVVWQQMWPTVKRWVVELFQASLRLSYFSSAWKVAKIVVIPKGGRDPSLPKSYRPISLLATLGKVLEAVVANRISALVEKHQLLPPNHFGAAISPCTNTFSRTMGLPCAHRIATLLEGNAAIPLSDIHPFWRIGLSDTEDISEHLPLLEPLIPLPKPKKRKRDEVEQKKVEEPIQKRKKAPSECTACGIVGHTRRSCTM